MSALLRTDVDSLVRPRQRNDRPTLSPRGLRALCKRSRKSTSLAVDNFSTNDPSARPLLFQQPRLKLPPPGALKAEDELAVRPADASPACHQSLSLPFKRSRRTGFFKSWPSLTLQVLPRISRNSRREKKKESFLQKCSVNFERYTTAEMCCYTWNEQNSTWKLKLAELWQKMKPVKQ